MAAVQDRSLAAREQHLETRELLKPCESLNYQTWSPILKGSTQTGQLPLFSSDTTLVSKAWEVKREMRIVKSEICGRVKDWEGTSMPVGVMGGAPPSCPASWTTILTPFR